MIELEHSPLGGSGATRWINCGGSFLLQRLLMLWGEFEPAPVSGYADLGTAAHELGAMCLEQNKEPFEFIGQQIGAYKVSAGDLSPDAVSVYVATCQAIAGAGGGDGWTAIEKTIHLPDIHPLFKGTVDFGHWRFRVNPGLWLLDYKNGEGIGVRAAGNNQLLYYATLLILAHEELCRLPREFPVYLGIVQPNYWGMFDEPEVWATTLGHVSDWAEHVLLPTMNRLWGDKREELDLDDFCPGDWCQFCPVLLDCPKAKDAFETYANGEEFVAMLTDQELSDYYAKRDLAKKFGNELEKVVFARKMSGRDIPSAKLVEKMTHRVWSPGAEQAAVQKFGDSAYNPRKLKSPAQLEKLSTDGKSFAVQYGFKPESEKWTVAPVSDRRPEVKPPSNADIFKNFAQPVDLAALFA